MRQDVMKLRHQLGIPKYDRVAPVAHLIGRVPDARLARRVGCWPATITKRRRQMGLPPANRKKANADALLRQYVDALNKELD